MNKRRLNYLLVVLSLSFVLHAQEETILFGQQKAINNLSSDAGLSNNNLDSYLKNAIRDHYIN